MATLAPPLAILLALLRLAGAAFPEEPGPLSSVPSEGEISPAFTRHCMEGQGSRVVWEQPRGHAAGCGGCRPKGQGSEGEGVRAADGF